MALIGRAVTEKKMFKNNGHVHAHNLGAGADQPLVSIVFKDIIYYFNSAIRACMFPLNYFVIFFQFKTHRRTNLILP